jgi:hypothetical protein
MHHPRGPKPALILRILQICDASNDGGYMKPYSPINFENKFQRLSEQWSPRVVAEMNDYQFKVARLEGDFVWHHHLDTDETFIVLDGH